MNPPTRIVTACGTGGTMAGLIEGIKQAQWHTKIIGIPVLKNGLFLEKDIQQLLSENNQVEWQLYDNYDFGGYAKTTHELRQFGVDFVEKTQIDLDKIYTSKAFYATFDLIDKGLIPVKSRVVILHTGGLQGIKGMNMKLQQKGLPLII